MVTSRRYFFTRGLQFLAVLVPFVATKSNATTPKDPRPEFATQSIDQSAEFLFETSDASDDGSIEMTIPLETGHQFLVPFKIRAPGAEKIALFFDGNEQPLILTMDQITQPEAVVIGRLRIEHPGNLICYVLRNGSIGRASRRVSVSGHWMRTN